MNDEHRQHIPMVKLRCFQCGHVWIPRTELTPVACPYCKTFNWKEDVFRDKNQQTLRS